VPHVKRPALASRFPVHVTLSMEKDLPNLRSPAVFRVVKQSLSLSREREDFRLVHYSVQGHHLHLIVEAHNAEALSRGIKGLSVRMAKRLNFALKRRGRVFSDRYFSRILRTPSQTKGALAYVLLNSRRHDAQRRRARDRGWVDPCSSGRFFDGWRDSPIRPRPGEPPCVASPHGWLLSKGWRLRGLLSVNQVPGPPPVAPRRRPMSALVYDRHRASVNVSESCHGARYPELCGGLGARAAPARF
jgi:REP element-mobilizing transposase RayT